MLSTNVTGVIWMIQINGIWEPVQDVDDLFRITKENMGYEFACELKRVYSLPNEELNDKIRELQSELDELETITNDYEEIQERLDYMEEQLSGLREYVAANDDGSEYINGIKKAIEMIE